MRDAPTGFHDDVPLRREDLLDDPIEQFRRWLGDAEAAGIPLPNAMAVATADAEGRPSVRHVLLRGVDERGFTSSRTTTAARAASSPRTRTPASCSCGNSWIAR